MFALIVVPYAFQFLFVSKGYNIASEVSRRAKAFYLAISFGKTTQPFLYEQLPLGRSVEANCLDGGSESSGGSHVPLCV